MHARTHAQKSRTYIHPPRRPVPSRPVPSRSVSPLHPQHTPTPQFATIYSHKQASKLQFKGRMAAKNMTLQHVLKPLEEKVRRQKQMQKQVRDCEGIKISRRFAHITHVFGVLVVIPHHTSNPLRQFADLHISLTNALKYKYRVSTGGSVASSINARHGSARTRASLGSATGSAGGTPGGFGGIPGW